MKVFTLNYHEFLLQLIQVVMSCLVSFRIFFGGFSNRENYNSSILLKTEK